MLDGNRSLRGRPRKIESDQPSYCTLVDLLPVTYEDTIHLRDPCGEHSRGAKDKGFESFSKEGIVVTP